MTLLRSVWYCLWVAPHILMGVVVFVMVRRRLDRQFPMFFLYAAFEILQFLVLFSVSQALGFVGTYERLYSVGLALSTAIRFGVILELFTHFSRRYPALDGATRFLFRSATIVLLLLAVGLAVSAPGTGTSFLLNATYISDRTVSVLQSGLLISLFLFSRYFSLSWRSHAFGIALGLGIFASVELASSAVRLHLKVFGNTLVNLLTMATYSCCALIWLFYLVADEEQHERPSLGPPTLPPKYNLDIWNQELQRLLQR
jgi:hypothetical protein